MNTAESTPINKDVYDYTSSINLFGELVNIKPIGKNYIRLSIQVGPNKIIESYAKKSLITNIQNNHKYIFNGLFGFNQCGSLLGDTPLASFEFFITDIHLVI